MPNICIFEMRIRGYKDNVEEFYRILNADYNYNTLNFNHDRHFFRIFDVYPVMEDIYGVYKTLIVRGECAWSVYTCMFNGACTYYNNYIGDRTVDRYDKFKGKITKEELSLADIKCTHILRESKRLGLCIEIFTEESGMCFSEHYLMYNGILLRDEDHIFYSIFKEDYKSLEDINKEFNINMTKEQYDLYENEEIIDYTDYDIYVYNDKSKLPYKNIVCKKIKRCKDCPKALDGICTINGSEISSNYTCGFSKINMNYNCIL